MAPAMMASRCLRRGGCAQAPGGSRSRPCVSGRNMARTISYFSSSTANGLGLVDAGLLAVVAGILAERALEVLRDADVVHDQPGRLVAEDAVDAGDGLHQAVALHRLVHVHRVHAGRVEAGQPHVADDDELERVVRRSWRAWRAVPVAPWAACRYGAAMPADRRRRRSSRP